MSVLIYLWISISADMKEYTNKKCMFNSSVRWLGPCGGSMRQLLQEENKEDGSWGLTLAPFLMADLQILLSLAIGKPI